MWSPCNTVLFFSLYTSEERLGKDDAFFCPQCNKKREVVKKLGVWSIPDVLVIHLKRFRHSTRSSNKLDTMVDFPLENFDMSPNMAKTPQRHWPRVLASNMRFSRHPSCKNSANNTYLPAAAQSLLSDGIDMT